MDRDGHLRVADFGLSKQGVEGIHKTLGMNPES